MHYVDAPAFNLLLALPSFPFGKCVRPSKASLQAAKANFFDDGQVPTFTFDRALAFDVAGYREALSQARQQLHTLTLPNAVTQLYHEKLSELGTRADLVDAVTRADDDTVHAASLKLYGAPTQNAAELADEFDSVLARANALFRHRTTVSATLFAEMVRRTCEHYDLHDWRIHLTNAPRVRIGRSTVVGKTPVIHIPKSLAISRGRAARLLTHELEVHALRTENGYRSGLQLLSRGLAGYVRTDEGLAIYYQQKLRTPEAVDAGFWDAWATALTDVHGFADAYGILFEAQRALGVAIGDPNPYARAKDSAWRLCTRVYRGITRPHKPGVGYMRDHVYRSGLADVRRLIDQGSPSDINLLLAGHAAVAHLPTLRDLNISPGRTPDMIGKRVVNDVMREHRRVRRDGPPNVS